MMALGIYWSVVTYLDWQGSPVLTTVASTAYAIQNVPFPAVTICAPGYKSIFILYYIVLIAIDIKQYY